MNWRARGAENPKSHPAAVGVALEAVAAQAEAVAVEKAEVEVEAAVEAVASKEMAEQVAQEAAALVV